METSSFSEHIAREVGSKLLLFSLVFGMSATVDLSSLKRQITNKAAICTGLFLQFVVIPFLGFAVVKTLELSHPSGITLLILTSSPGGSYSNWWCSIFNADLSLSVTMTAISTICGILMLPCNLILYTTNTYTADVVASLDWPSLFISLCVVITAISLGLICSAKIESKEFNLYANRMGNISGIALVIFSVFVSELGQTSSSLWGQTWQFYLGVASPCVLGLAIATMFTTYLELPKPERVTVSVECCYQNVGICTSVAMTMFLNSKDLSDAIAVPLYYGLVEAVVLSIYCTFAWKIGWTKAPKDVNFLKMIGKSYEVSESNDDMNTSYSNDNGGNSNRDVTVMESAQMEEVIDDGIVVVEDLEENALASPSKHKNQVSFQFVMTPPTSNDIVAENSIEGYDNHMGTDGSGSLRFGKFSGFKNRFKKKDVQPPTLSPTTTLSPDAFKHTPRSNNSSNRSRNNPFIGGNSDAVRQLFVSSGPILEDSIGEDADLSVAGESDLESGLSVSDDSTTNSLSDFIPSPQSPLSPPSIKKKISTSDSELNSTSPFSSVTTAAATSTTSSSSRSSVVSNNKNNTSTTSTSQETSSASSSNAIPSMDGNRSKALAGADDKDYYLKRLENKEVDVKSVNISKKENGDSMSLITVSFSSSTVQPTLDDGTTKPNSSDSQSPTDDYEHATTKSLSSYDAQYSPIDDEHNSTKNLSSDTQHPIDEPVSSTDNHGLTDSKTLTSTDTQSALDDTEPEHVNNTASGDLGDTEDIHVSDQAAKEPVQESIQLSKKEYSVTHDDGSLASQSLFSI